MGETPIFMESHDAARELGRTPQTVRNLAKAGVLRVSAMTVRGVMLFRPVDVEILKQSRAARVRGGDGHR